MTNRHRCVGLFAIAAIMLITYSVPQVFADAPLALLLSVSGDVKIIRAGGAEEKGSFGLHLQAGDEIRTGKDASAEVLFDNNHIIAVGANSSMQVRGTTQKTSGQATGERSFQVAQNFLRLQNSTVTKLRGDGDNSLVAVTPRGTRVRTSHPIFEWTSQDSPELQITVYDDDGVVWQADASDGRALYPDGAPELTAGKSYSWTLETSDPLQIPPLRTQAAFFEVLSDESATALDEALAGIERGDGTSESSYRFLRASLYYEYGLLDEAIVETNTALQLDPNSPALNSILARLYAETGRYAEAIAAYEDR